MQGRHKTRGTRLRVKPFDVLPLPAPLLSSTTHGEADERQEQLERLAAVGQMMASIAHESRNSLQRIQIATDLLAMELEDSPRAAKDLAIIRQGAHEISLLLAEVQEFTAPLIWDESQCNLAQVWKSAWSKATAVASKTPPSLVEQCDGSTWIRGDSFQLERVFRNLFENSLQACGADPHIVLSCSTNRLNGQAGLIVALRDNGAGFTPGSAQRVFDPFFTTKQSGTGLGLAIVKRIVEAHGGTIAIGADQNPGAEILINLPMDETSPSDTSQCSELAFHSNR